MAELSDEIHDEIGRLCAEGDDLAEEDDFAAAIRKYDQAWQLLPDPKHEWEAATWVLTAIGDAYFLARDYPAAKEALTSAMHAPDAIGNPFIHLRLGQSQLEVGNTDRAADELIRAYMGAGPDIFAEEDRKYLEFLATRAQGIEFPDREG